MTLSGVIGPRITIQNAYQPRLRSVCGRSLPPPFLAVVSPSRLGLRPHTPLPLSTPSWITKRAVVPWSSLLCACIDLKGNLRNHLNHCCVLKITVKLIQTTVKSQDFEIGKLFKIVC